MSETVLCYIEENGRYLMLYRNKKKDDINHGKWLGIGGHIEPGESEEECCRREIKEEAGLSGGTLSKVGEVDFISGEYSEKMHLFTGAGFEGEISECDEGELRWIPMEELPSIEVWEGDRIFLDLLMKKESGFQLALWYNGDNLEGYELKWNK